MFKKALLVFCLSAISVTFAACKTNSIESDQSETDLGNHVVEEANEDEEGTKTIDVYAGPGAGYMLNDTISKSSIGKLVKVEGDWVEIEYGGKRGYVEQTTVSDLYTDDIPHVVKNIGQNVYPYPTIGYLGIQTSLFDEAKLYYKPNGTEYGTIDKGESVTLLCLEQSKIKEYLQIEVEEDGEKRRYYADKIDLLSLDNPLLNFDDVKTQNAMLTYNHIDYYSSSGETTVLSNGWHKEDEISISKTEWDWVSGITNMIASNDINEETINSTEGTLYLWNSKEDIYVNANTKNNQLSKMSSLMDFLIGNTISFVQGAQNTINLKVEFQEYKNEHKMVIKTGAPIETKYAGKTCSLSSLIVEKNNTWLTAVESSKLEDEMIKNMYPELDMKKKYTMQLTFSNDFDQNNYGYYLVIDNKLNIYAVPIIHNGTSLAIYSEGKFVKDAVWDLARCMIKVEEDCSQKILELLAENGFRMKGQNEKYLNPQITEQKQYLEELEIVAASQYTGNLGDSFIYKLGEHKDTRGNTDINGQSYSHGIEAWIARWNNIAEMSWASSTFQLDGAYSTITGSCVLIDSYNTDNFDSTLEVYADETLVYTYHLSPNSIPFEIEWDVKGADQLRIYVYDNIAVPGGTSFGLVDMRLE